jgi:hypothetical protein
VEIIVIVLTVVGVILGGAQVYYARRQAASSSTPSPSMLAQVPDTPAGPECRYLVVEGYTNKTWNAEKIDVSWATLTVDGTTFQFDGGDITPNRVFALKGYTPGSYLFTADFRFYEQPASMNRHYAADIVLDQSTFYVLKWQPFTYEYGPPDTRHVSVAPISEDLFREMTSTNVAVLPSCKALKRGVTRL